MRQFIAPLATALLLTALPAQAVTLIKDSEAKLPAASGGLATRGVTRGPAIKQVLPAADEAIKSPFNLKVNFEPRGGATIDPASLKVTYLKSPGVDLTDRLKPALTAGGIDLASAEVPSGEHQLSISITDSEGRQSNSVITLKVGK